MQDLRFWDMMPSQLVKLLTFRRSVSHSPSGFLLGLITQAASSSETSVTTEHGAIILETLTFITYNASFSLHNF
jgi:hypothetical protein